MEKLEKITQEQEAMIPIVRQEWLNLFYKNKGVLDKSLFDKQIAWLYKKYLNKKAPYVWYCDSPLMVQLVINIFNHNANLGANLGANLWDNLGANLINYFLPSYWGNVSDYGWTAFYDFIQKLNHFKYDYSDFDDFKLLLKSGVYDFVAFSSIVFVSSCPFEVHQEANTRIHNINGPAVRFKDGYDVYAIHGRILPSWIWTDKNKITKEQFIFAKNAEIRAGIYSVLGEKKIMEILDCKEIDKQCIQHQNGDIEIVKLYKTRELVQITNSLSNYLAWVKFICPSTGTEYLIACEPEHENAKEAAASLSIFDKSEYSFNFRT
ncbi:MAG: hypothetical protein LLG05_05780 [Porphyromonadaceae bacterium]|nr:hypothetical protein [Porphyromonadaceae bacterium]